MRQRLIIAIVLIVCLAASGARQPALALSKDTSFNLTMAGLASIGAPLLAYYLYKSSPAQRAKGYEEALGPGEWFLAAYAGLGLIPSGDWSFYVAGNTFQHPDPRLLSRKALNVHYSPGPVGGVKFGRYFDAVPWFGMEVETNFTRHAIPPQQVQLSPSTPAPSTARVPSDYFDIWALQLNFLFRYGFLQDKEVPFGRLQPYLGIGPGFEVVYGRYDSGKNLAYEVLGGLRYLFTSKIALFCEYKFSYQYQVAMKFWSNKGFPPFGETPFHYDVPHHRIVLGFSYHFKNLFGN